MIACFFCRYFAFVEDCKEAKACTILLRGPSKDILAELERNLQDCIGDARAILSNPRLLPGGGATEIAAAIHLEQLASTTTNPLALEGIERGPFLAIAAALEIIPRTLLQNCGSDAVRLITDLRAKHTKRLSTDCSLWGIDGITGTLQDMSNDSAVSIWEPFAVKAQYLKSAIEAACMILRVDDIVAGKSQAKENSSHNSTEDIDHHEGHEH